MVAVHRLMTAATSAAAATLAIRPTAAAAPATMAIAATAAHAFHVHRYGVRRLAIAPPEQGKPLPGTRDYRVASSRQAFMRRGSNRTRIIALAQPLLPAVGGHAPLRRNSLIPRSRTDKRFFCKN
jgi:hypothetical protein